jgi:hypothetical protein
MSRRCPRCSTCSVVFVGFARCIQTRRHEGTYPPFGFSMLCVARLDPPRRWTSSSLGMRWLKQNGPLFPHCDVCGVQRISGRRFSPIGTTRVEPWMAALMPMKSSLFVDFLGAYNSFLGPHSMIYGTVKTRAHKWPHGTCPLGCLQGTIRIRCGLLQSHC